MTPTLVSSTAQAIWAMQAGPVHAAQIAVGAWQRARQPVHGFQDFYELVNRAITDLALEQLRTGPKPSVVAGHLLAPYRSILSPEQVVALEGDFRARMPEWSSAADWPAQAASVLADAVARVIAHPSTSTEGKREPLERPEPNPTRTYSVTL